MKTLCKRIKGANREVSEGKLMSDRCNFSSYQGHKERRTDKTRGAFKNAQGFERLDAGSRAGFTSSLHHHGPRYFNFPYFCTMCGLEKLGLVDQNWLVSGLLLRTLVVGRRQQSKSIEAALDIWSKEV